MAIQARRKKGRNDRKYNNNKYNPKRLATAGHRVLSNGSIVSRVLLKKKRKQDTYNER